jgi:hypothetical protein
MRWRTILNRTALTTGKPTDSHLWASLFPIDAQPPPLLPSVMAKTKNSLVNNINKRKAKGTSRPKSKSTVSPKAYAAMKKGWK